MTKAEISIYVGRAKREMRAAEEMLKSTLESRMSVLGPAHEDTLKSMNALASCFYEAGDYASAEPLYRQALASGKAALGDTHQVTLSSMNNLVSSELTAALDLESHNPEPPVSFAATELTHAFSLAGQPAAQQGYARDRRRDQRARREAARSRCRARSRRPHLR